MSDAFAVAAVTAALTSALRDAVAPTAVSDALGGTPKVSAGPPDLVNPQGTVDQPQLNLFLYSVTENPGWRNLHQPVRDSSGERVGRQPLALDLHYLLTAYATADYGAEILLGHGMQALHEVPYFARGWLGDVLKSGAPPNDIPAALETTGLPEQVEQIRITPTTLSLDDMSRIWSAMQARYRPTASYQVTVVLVEGRRPARPAPPVTQRVVNVATLAPLRIDAAVNAAGDTEPLAAGEVLRLRGAGFGSADVQVRFMGVDVSGSIQRRTETELDVELEDPLQAGLRAGVVPVQLVRPTVGNASLSSNAVAILLRPTIKTKTVLAAKLRVKFAPSVTASQRVVLLLDEHQPAAGTRPRSFGIAAPPRNGITGAATETDTIEFPRAGVAAGKYLMRLQVDGAESLLAVDATERFDTPNVTIP